MLDGWRESKGVQAEIRIAEEMGKRVMLVEPERALNDRTPVAASRAGVVEAEVDGEPTP
jgi:hypothetical protein